MAGADREDPGLGGRVDPEPARRPVLAQRVAAPRVRADHLPGADLRRVAGRLPDGGAAHGRTAGGAVGAPGGTMVPHAARPRRARPALPVPGRDGAVLPSPSG